MASAVVGMISVFFVQYLSERSKFLNLPNQLTVLRIIMIPIFILVLALPIDLGTLDVGGVDLLTTHLIAAILFAVASITDWLDGKIARSRGLVTNFGKFADPLADKMLVMTAFIMLVELDKAPAWVVSIIICRELAVTGLRLLLVEHHGEVLAAAWLVNQKQQHKWLPLFSYLLTIFLFHS